MPEPAKVGVCSRGVTHRPRPADTVLHHVVPESWGGPTEPANLVELCDNCHVAVHVVIDLAVAGAIIGSVPILRRYGAFVNDLAQRAWDGRPANPTRTRIVAG